MTLRPLNTSFSCPGTLIPQSIITDSNWYINDKSYSAEAHLYLSAQPSVFYHIVINAEVNNI